MPASLLATFLLVGALPASGSQPLSGRTERASLAPDGTESNGASTSPAITPDGRHVAFDSLSSNLVPGDTNGRPDVFVRDQETADVERVSVSSSGQQGTGTAYSYSPSISDDGMIVAFEHLRFGSGTGLSPDDTNGDMDVYVRDRAAGTTERVSVASDGSEGDGRSAAPAISADGRYVAFHSQATNFVEDDQNVGPGFEDGLDVFVHDRETGETELVSVATDGTQANAISSSPAISGDGRYVAFQGYADNLVEDGTGTADIYVHDRVTGETELVSVGPDGEPTADTSFLPDFSSDGRWLTWYDERCTPGQGCTHPVYVHDRGTGKTELASVATDGAPADRGGFNPAISADGRYVSFDSNASNLADPNPGGTVVYLRDREAGVTELVSVATDGSYPNDSAVRSALTDDGRYVAFFSPASNLVHGDSNGAADIFVRDRAAPVANGTYLAEVAAERRGAEVTVSGRLRTVDAVATSAVDPSDDGIPGAVPAGAELTGASITYRPRGGHIGGCFGLCPLPEKPDLFVRMGLMQHTTGLATTVMHALEITVDGVPYEIRGVRDAIAQGGGGTPRLENSFALYRCEGDCEKIDDLDGAYTFPWASDDTGFDGNAEIQVSVKLPQLGAEEGTVLRGLRAYSAIGDAGVGTLAEADDIAIEDGEILRWSVDVGVSAADASGGEVTFTAAATSPDGAFAETLPVADLSAGDLLGWARACLGETCETLSVPVADGQEGPRR